MRTKISEPDEVDYATRVDVNMAIIREMAKIRFKERLPRIMTELTKQLIAAGVDFSKARAPLTLTITEDEWDTIYQDFR